MHRSVNQVSENCVNYRCKPYQTIYFPELLGSVQVCRHVNWYNLHLFVTVAAFLFLLYSIWSCNKMRLLLCYIIGKDKTSEYLVIVSLRFVHRATDITMHTINIFCDKNFNLNWILCCDHSLESSRRDDSNEWWQHRNKLRNKKVSI